MMTNRLPLVVFCAALLFPAIVHACMMSEERKAELFMQYDTDNDGQVSVDEFLEGEKSRADASPYDEDSLLEHFMDVDHDGSETLSTAEFAPTNGQKRCG